MDNLTSIKILMNSLKFKIEEIIEAICVDNKNNGLSNVKVNIFNCDCSGCIDVNDNNIITIFFGEDTYKLCELSIDDLFNMYKTLVNTFYSLDISETEKKKDDDYILIENGDMFDGTRLQFADCFFSNSTNEQITDWCKTHGWSLNINNRKIL